MRDLWAEGKRVSATDGRSGGGVAAPATRKSRGKEARQVIVARWGRPKQIVAGSAGALSKARAIGGSWHLRDPRASLRWTSDSLRLPRL